MPLFRTKLSSATSLQGAGVGHLWLSLPCNRQCVLAPVFSTGPFSSPLLFAKECIPGFIDQPLVFFSPVTRRLPPGHLFLLLRRRIQRRSFRARGRFFPTRRRFGRGSPLHVPRRGLRRGARGYLFSQRPSFCPWRGFFR